VLVAENVAANGTGQVIRYIIATTAKPDFSPHPRDGFTEGLNF
jgi:hypothetical protein